jgi:hypothetical protein
MKFTIRTTEGGWWIYRGGEDEIQSAMKCGDPLRVRAEDGEALWVIDGFKIVAYRAEDW